MDSIVNFLSGADALWTLAASAFLSSTLLPGNSEIVFTATLSTLPTSERAVILICVATLGNSLGSLTSFLIGRFFPYKAPNTTALKYLKRWGAPLLFFSWIPVIGDMLPLAAGWLKIHCLSAIFWTTLGKGVRYALLALIVLGIF